LINCFEFDKSDPKEAVAELSALCVALERYGMISEYVFSTIYQLLGQLYPQELKKMNKGLGFESGTPLGDGGSPSELIDYVKNIEELVLDYRNTIVHALNSDKFITEDEGFKAALKAIKKMR
jgi:hypothetical protein